MSIFQAFILGVIQGLTEFLPISSSAHLVLAPYLLGWKIPESQVFSFDVLVQMGTLVAVILYFRKEILDIAQAWLSGLLHRQPFYNAHARMGWYLILATVPAGLFGLLLKDLVERAFNSPIATAWFLLITALLLWAAEIIGKRNRTIEAITWKDALWIGCFQVLSVFPGISRSGSTIAGGLTRNLERRDAGRFAFLMAIPVMTAAGLLSLLDLIRLPSLGAFLPVLAVGFVTSALVGYFSIQWLLSFLARRSLKLFAVYCALLATIVLLLAYVFA